jgi:hypothetical protein
MRGPAWRLLSRAPVAAIRCDARRVRWVGLTQTPQAITRLATRLVGRCQTAAPGCDGLSRLTMSASFGSSGYLDSYVRSGHLTHLRRAGQREGGPSTSSSANWSGTGVAPGQAVLVGQGGGVTAAAAVAVTSDPHQRYRWSSIGTSSDSTRNALICDEGVSAGRRLRSDICQLVLPLPLPHGRASGVTAAPLPR